jgi:hypothetical protein
VAGLFWEKSTAGWWLISQANRVTIWNLTKFIMKNINVYHIKYVHYEKIFVRHKKYWYDIFLYKLGQTQYDLT